MNPKSADAVVYWSCFRTQEQGNESRWQMSRSGQRV